MSTTAVFVGVDYASEYVFRGALIRCSNTTKHGYKYSWFRYWSMGTYDTGSDSFEEVDLAIGYDVAEVSYSYFCWIM